MIIHVHVDRNDLQPSGKVELALKQLYTYLANGINQ